MKFLHGMLNFLQSYFKLQHGNDGHTETCGKKRHQLITGQWKIIPQGEIASLPSDTNAAWDLLCIHVKQTLCSQNQMLKLEKNFGRYINLLSIIVLIENLILSL